MLNKDCLYPLKTVITAMYIRIRNHEIYIGTSGISNFSIKRCSEIAWNAGRHNYRILDWYQKSDKTRDALTSLVLWYRSLDEKNDKECVSDILKCKDCITKIHHKWLWSKQTAGQERCWIVYIVIFALSPQ